MRFRDVQAARADLERLQNEAADLANRVVPDARPCRAKSCRSPKATSSRRSPRPRARAARFLKVYEEYNKAKDVTRQRIYLETMERILGGSEKLVYDGGASAQSIVPYLPLSELTPRRPPAAPTTGQPQQGGGRAMRSPVTGIAP